MVTTTYPSSPPASVNKEWLPMPRGITLKDTFADDLIRQFDKKRINLHKDLGDFQDHDSLPSSSSPIESASPSFTNLSPSILQPSIRPVSSTNSTITTPSRKTNRRSSAGDLLRRSSAFFRATLDHTWKNISRSHDNLRNKEQHHQEEENNDMISDTPALPATIAINTTITLPITRKSSQHSFPPLQPPVISQYPPKPLHYSPVSLTNNHDLISSNDDPSRKTLIHRISMPALRRRVSNFGSTSDTGQQQVGNQAQLRRKSDGTMPLFRKKRSSQS
ncbi:uncharacterized protein BX664DRAFT_325579 [Halteromyces radiatus]|uniref:uncharacterized protein n=1 Tax=Halteromyces radiatus TaxID=101107 RepID=UPI00222073E8|nr:uncharacterized protein BX664DRAFT_325579 [Halteromyces radiatus]KAI8097106.1 hypothetical protein BX664DRAFT_325579 [Halteromyces radiatus]